MSKLAVHISWPYSMLPWTFYASLWNSDVRLEKDVVLLRSVSPCPGLGGNMAVKVAMELGAEEMLFADVDQGIPVDILKRFRAHNVEIVGALTALRAQPHRWSMFKFGEGELKGKKVFIEPTERLQKVDATGNGCMLAKMSVFEKIPRPWFMNETSEDGCEILKSTDFYFFEKAAAHGVSCYIDTTVESPHYTEVMLNAQTLGRKIEYTEAIMAQPSPTVEQYVSRR